MMMDWPTTVAEFERRFETRKVYVHDSRAAGFEGRNFMTPEVLGYVKAADGKTIVEISTGTGFRHERIFGVTYPTIDGEKDDRSKCCHSFHEIELALGWM